MRITPQQVESIVGTVHHYIDDKEQGNDTDELNQESLLSINFDISTVRALIVTHCHIDNVGRIPYLLAAGYRGPIYATTSTAANSPSLLKMY